MRVTLKIDTSSPARVHSSHCLFLVIRYQRIHKYYDAEETCISNSNPVFQARLKINILRECNTGRDKLGIVLSLCAAVHIPVQCHKPTVIFFHCQSSVSKLGMSHRYHFI